MYEKEDGSTCRSDETLNAVGPSYLLSIIDSTQGVNVSPVLDSHGGVLIFNLLMIACLCVNTLICLSNVSTKFYYLFNLFN